MKHWLKILLALFFVGLIALFLVYKFVYNKPHQDIENSNATFTISAAELYNSFIANNITAGKKYSDQVVEISGPISSITLADTLVIAVFAFKHGDFGDEGVRCSFLKKYNEDAKKLVSGTNVKIKGQCKGFNDPDVIIEQCSIIK